MAIPSTSAPVNHRDFTLTPLHVFKPYKIDNNSIQELDSGYNLVEGYYTKLITPVGSSKADNDPKNDDGSFKHIIWKHIDHLYYRNGYSPTLTLEHSNRRYTEKFLNVSASYLSIPYFKYGEMIKPKSFELINITDNIKVIDDGEGNLYDPDLESNLPLIQDHSIISYWGFNNSFRYLKYDRGLVKNKMYQYESNTFSPYTYQSKINNVYFEPGVEIDELTSGMCANFLQDENSYILTPNNDSYNFDNEDEFTISFWFSPNINYNHSLNNGSIISKNGVRFKNQFGNFKKETLDGTFTKKFISSSYVDESTDVYPYDIAWNGQDIIFKRSDGSRVLTIQAPIETDFTSSASQDYYIWNHVSVIKYNVGSTKRIAMYINGSKTHDVIDPTNNPINNFALMFGAKNRNNQNPYIGKLDEIKFINKAYMDGQQLDDNFYFKISQPEYAYNTSVVGNVFYRSGNIVVSPIYPKYKNLLKNNFEIKYKGKHTVYQYEVLCRIKKGQFNSTLNPTALKSSKSQYFIKEITQEISGSILRPYITSIGLYNEMGDLVAIGKMGQPIQMRDDVDINILVRWDS
jgi:hypothetical protein